MGCFTAFSHGRNILNNSDANAFANAFKVHPLISCNDSTSALFCDKHPNYFAVLGFLMDYDVTPLLSTAVLHFL